MALRHTAPRKDIDVEVGPRKPCATRTHTGSDGSDSSVNSDLGHKSDVEPDQLS